MKCLKDAIHKHETINNYILTNTVTIVTRDTQDSCNENYKPLTDTCKSKWNHCLILSEKTQTCKKIIIIK